MSNEMNTVNQKNTQTPVEQTADGRYKVTKRDLRRTAQDITSWHVTFSTMNLRWDRQLPGRWHRYFARFTKMMKNIKQR